MLDPQAESFTLDEFAQRWAHELGQPQLSEALFRRLLVAFLSGVIPESEIGWYPAKDLLSRRQDGPPTGIGYTRVHLRHDDWAALDRWHNEGGANPANLFPNDLLGVERWPRFERVPLKYLLGFPPLCDSNVVGREVLDWPDAQRHDWLANIDPGAFDEDERRFLGNCAATAGGIATWLAGCGEPIPVFLARIVDAPTRSSEAAAACLTRGIVQTSGQKDVGDVQPIDVADPYRTGMQGRPSIKHLILQEFDRRFQNEECSPDLTDEAKALHDWAAATHPRAPVAGVGTIKNQIRPVFRERFGSKRTK